jgi:acetyl-CoA carboxylase biotin carboxylase subunit
VFKKVLIANRGEIALRVIRACRELGVQTVAVYSEADRESLHVRFADDDVCIGPAAARDSYLKIPRIIAAAEIAGADAIHPGYGFLAENAEFAEICTASNITFIGPTAEQIRVMGDKAAARKAMTAVGVPIVPGTPGPVEDVEEALEFARTIGFPVIIKAAAGGGGKGMRVAKDADEFERSFSLARSEALSAFGNGDVYVEKYLMRPRHIEFQILGDKYGRVIHLGERDCSVQRRHQKLIEETPAPRLPAGLAERMGRAAVDGALAAGYVGAGTFEFLVDPEGGFSFMEVNCRIQVEHPVTEMVTGIDLVQEQIRIAAGQPLTLTQADVHPRGVAIECRINAEDPERDFMPAPGPIDEFVPADGPFVRTDTHVYPGYVVPAQYDSLLAKLVVWAPDRDRAIARMQRALAEQRLSGPRLRTTTTFLAELLATPAFTAAEHSTSLVDEVLAGRASALAQ